MRAAIYTRISNDKAGGGLGVERQREDCAALADRLGWSVIETFVDNDISAYSGKPRPGYLAMLEALKEGRINAIVAWHADRLHRLLSELEDFIDICERHEVEVQTVQAGRLDLSTPSGRMVARMLGAVAKHETEHARERMLRAHQQGAKEGRAHGKIPFGYEPVLNDMGKIVGRVPHPAEGPMVKDAVARALKGESLYSIRQEWTEKGMLARNGKPWDASNFKQMLVRPTYAGLRVRNGEVSTASNWEPLITPDQHYQLVAILTAPSRVSSRGNDPRHLLTGIAKCGECGKPMWRLKSNGKDALTCQDRCVSRVMAPVDAMVEELVLQWAEKLSGPDDLRDPEAAEAAAKVRELRARLDGFEEKAADGTITVEMLGRMEQKLLPLIKAAEKRARQVPQPQVLELLGVNARAHWANMDIAGKRIVVRSLLSVAILKAKRGKVFDPRSISVEWL